MSLQVCGILAILCHCLDDNKAMHSGFCCQSHDDESWSICRLVFFSPKPSNCQVASGRVVHVGCTGPTQTYRVGSSQETELLH